MPVILNKDKVQNWINTKNISVPNALALLKPYDGYLTTYTVSEMVNSPKNNSRDCLIPTDNRETLDIFN